MIGRFSREDLFEQQGSRLERWEYSILGWFSNRLEVLEMLQRCPKMVLLSSNICIK